MGFYWQLSFLANAKLSNMLLQYSKITTHLHFVRKYALKTQPLLCCSVLVVWRTVVYKIKILLPIRITP